MHKNIVVAELQIDKETGKLSHVIEVFNAAHMPIGGSLNEDKLKSWWYDRAIPKTRENIETAYRVLNTKNLLRFMLENLSLSLTDCYWVRPMNIDLAWKDVSLYSNAFEDRVGEITLGVKVKNNILRNPLSQGNVVKMWGRDKKGIYMIKGNDEELGYQQSINELFATRINELQQFNSYIPYYRVNNDRKGVWCLSYNCCNENVEFVSAWELLQSEKKSNNESYFGQLKRICITRLGFTEDYFDVFMSYEIMLDFIMTNVDRHMNNIGVLRNPDTLQYYGFAPIYDNGNSMLYSDSIDMRNLLNQKASSFSIWEVNLLKYVTKSNILQVDKLPIKEEFFRLYELEESIRKDRIRGLYEYYNGKVKLLRRFQQGEKIWILKRRKLY